MGMGSDCANPTLTTPYIYSLHCLIYFNQNSIWISLLKSTNMASCPKSAALLPLSLFLLLLLLTLGNQQDQEDALVEEWIQCVEKQHYYSPFGSDNPISESIYTRKNSSFLSTLNWRANNLRYTGPQTWKPLLIVTPKEEHVIPQIITCTRIHGLKIRIRSGGHDFEGVSYTAPFGVPFVLLDMFNLNKVEVEIETESACVQSGATLGEIYYRIAEKSGVHAFPAGICPTVGAGGHISGGGYGVLMRKYGLTVDNVVDARVVDAQGRVLERESMGEDLFWAIRGGGASSFGVILAWKIKLVRVPPIVTVFNLQKDILAPGVNHLLYKWQEVAPRLPKEVFLRVETTAYVDLNSNFVANASFISFFMGNKESLVKIMDEKFPELGLKPEHCKEMPWIDSVLFFHRFPEGTPRETLLDYNSQGRSPHFTKIKGDFVKRPIPEDALLDIWNKIKEIGMIYMEWSPYGGRMEEIDESALPYSHRKGNLYSVFYDTMWFDDSMNDYCLNKSRELYAFMEPYVSNSPRESLLNYVDLDLEASGQKYFGKNFARLVKVKTRVDPTDFFSHQNSIPTAYKLLESRKLRHSKSNGALYLSM